MEDKKTLTNKKYPAIFFMLLFSLCLFAQDGTVKTEADTSGSSDVKKNYIIETEGKKAVFYQTLSWENVEGILHFEFELEKKEKNGKWIITDKRKLKKNSIELSLSHGNYRYRVKVINLLGQADTVSADRYFDILLAYQPETSSVSPNAVYFDEDNFDVVSLSGKNFRKETVFALQKEWGSPILGKIEEINPSGTKAKIRFNVLKINPGKYNVVVTDPSGLKDSKQTIVFAFQKMMDIYLSGGYAFNGFAGNQLLKKYFKKNFAALGGILRFSLVPIKRFYGNFGFNLSLSGMYLRNKEEAYTLSSGFILPAVQAVYMKPIIRNLLNFDFHLGMGCAFMVNTKFVFAELKSPEYWYWGPAVNFGTALQVYAYKKLYVELNVDHIVPIRTGFPKYIVQPSLSVGWEF
ncbi:MULTISPECIES: fibronectin type III domain-containing protein [unclassified Treponema]|uniref:fibronectin type III domain-containing protein n=1 Tax=unclassified Treponema TaxID=2638727 RepID=UPI0020A24608|nr:MULTISPECIES: fibronectin type III domain-containing protein [unclassified Treponema]UTC68396.1 fibronectin type III domain-containing protein [Treponema sp. OMZ 789]UTC71116.1 fibronectin type III domain-containing protein [Treponema sp. OMZ 790]UTC71270.1 fibronectin type III domain-containing protein [Treponema sp. OMZ 791]